MPILLCSLKTSAKGKSIGKLATMNTFLQNEQKNLLTKHTNYLEEQMISFSNPQLRIVRMEQDIRRSKFAFPWFNDCIVFSDNLTCSTSLNPGVLIFPSKVSEKAFKELGVTSEKPISHPGGRGR